MFSTGDRIKSSKIVPRVFLSYARSDGEDIARALRTRLESAGVSLWQDRISMTGGHDWWLQIVEALDQVEFMVLIMTPAAILSPIVKKEWHYARQRGVCIYPVKSPLSIDFFNLPRWMRDVHWYDIEHEWQKFIYDLTNTCERQSVPFMAPDLPTHFVERKHELTSLISAFISEQHDEAIATTVALRGTGGYGKTTLAIALCHNEHILHAFDDGVLWVTLGEAPQNLIGKVEDLIYVLSEKRLHFSEIEAAVAHLAKLLADRDILIVLDDVWNEVHLSPFFQGGKRCARLLTTRNEATLPLGARIIQVGAMHRHEAIDLLCAGINKEALSQESHLLHALVERMGDWPLLLKLSNGVLYERVHTYRQSVSGALLYIGKALDKYGLTAFDAGNALARSQAVRRTLNVSFELLSGEEYARFKELSIFPDDTDIPLANLGRLWGFTGGMDAIDTEKLCERLYSISLIQVFDLTTNVIRLHDMILELLRQDVKTEIVTFHTQFLNTYGLARWADLTQNDLYIWKHLTYHLLEAQQKEMLIATVKDLRYLATKIYVCGTSFVEMDLKTAIDVSRGDEVISLLKRYIIQMSHILSQGETLQTIEGILLSRLSQSGRKELDQLCNIFDSEIARPLLKAWHPFPDLIPHILLRTLRGHK